MSPSPLLPTTSRVDLGELKSQLAKRLGALRSRRYFDYLQRLLSHKLNKSEFNKLCFLTLGRENLPLHNELIRSVLKNACQAKAPPLQRKPVKRANGLDPPKPHNLANGDILLLPHCVHSPNEKANIAVQQNGELSSYDLERRVEVQGSQPTEKHVRWGHVRWVNTSSQGKEDVVMKENLDSLELVDDQNKRLRPLQAPLGIPFRQARVDLMKRYLPWTGRSTMDRFSSCLDNGELCHTDDLRKRMESVAGVQGMGVAAESAVLLNNGLDTYLKRLIRSSTELVTSRMDRKTIKQKLHLQESHGKLRTGDVWLDNPTNVRMCNMASEFQERARCLISLQDFTAAMELNPQQLGTNAPLLMEKIRLHSLTE